MDHRVIAKRKRGDDGGVPPLRSTEGYLRDTFRSVQLLSDPPDVQLAKIRDWQLRKHEITGQFELEWEAFRKFHHGPLPLNVAERLGWLAQLIAALPPDCDLHSDEWSEIRMTAGDVLKAM